MVVQCFLSRWRQDENRGRRIKLNKNQIENKSLTIAGLQKKNKNKENVIYGLEVFSGKDTDAGKCYKFYGYHLLYTV
ncbi:hypothetical protein ANTRET_LOCUS4280 [Anthophora retusa]